MDQLLRTAAVLAEDLSSILSTLMAAFTTMHTFQEIQPFIPMNSSGARHNLLFTCTHASKILLHINKSKEKKFKIIPYR